MYIHFLWTPQTVYVLVQKYLGSQVEDMIDRSCISSELYGQEHMIKLGLEETWISTN